MINLNQQIISIIHWPEIKLFIFPKKIITLFCYYSVYLESDWVDALKEYLISKYSVHPTLKWNKQRTKNRNQIIILVNEQKYIFQENISRLVLLIRSTKEKRHRNI